VLQTLWIFAMLLKEGRREVLGLYAPCGRR